MRSMVRPEAPTAIQPGDEGNLLWYKDAIIYEIHVRAFHDSNEDGIGDFVGLTRKLEYLKYLGVSAVWLLPFYPSPLRDGGYDIADYTGVNPAYGDMGDVRLFIREAHRMGIRVITELVCNHTSDQHPWFQRARRAKPGSAWRDFYVWSDDPNRYADARVIFKDFEQSNWTWDPVAGTYYWHRFYSHQPDLNFESPHVRRAFLRIMDFWFGLGVDGMRLDAVPYLFEREGTNCENLPETHEYLRELRAHVDRRWGADRVLLAEANQWPEDAVTYFGEGDECHMAFHFPVMPRLFMALRMEDRFPILDIMAQTPPIPDTAQWALFLRNHDELTLEMVTDEERDYMHRAYTRDPEARINLGIRHRLASLLRNDRRRMELMNGLLFSLPGTPVLYYGDEIGMGDNIYLGDRDGVRTPMQWSGDRNAGFSDAPRQRLYLPVIVDPESHYEAVNVQAQRQNPHSFLSWTRRMIALRKRHRAFGRGTVEFFQPDNRRVLVFLRRHEDELILVVANLSRFSQYAEIDLSRWAGLVPRELMGDTEFPRIGELPYLITLGPHAFYWFRLETPPAALEPEAEHRPPALAFPAGVALGTSGWEWLQPALAEHLRTSRWFSGKSRRITGSRIVDAVAFPTATDARLLVVEVRYADGDSETYLMPVAWTGGEEGRLLLDHAPRSVLAQAQDDSGLVVFDATHSVAFAGSVLESFVSRRQGRGDAMRLRLRQTHGFAHLHGSREDLLVPRAAAFEQSNSSVIYGDRLILKLFRRLHEGINPDVEISRFLTERGNFANAARVAGTIELETVGEGTATAGVLQQFIPNEGDAWAFTARHLASYFSLSAAPIELNGTGFLSGEMPAELSRQVGDYLGAARRLGQVTAEMHLALTCDPDDPAFAPEPWTGFNRRSDYQTMRALTINVLESLRRQLDTLPAEDRADAERVVASEPRILARMRALLDVEVNVLRIRCHGDYHLGQLLYDGADFHVIDFEGEPSRPISERRMKRLPLRDVASMIRSFDYAAHSDERGLPRPEVDSTRARAWFAAVASTYLRSYMAGCGDSPLLPEQHRALPVMLDCLLLERSIYEVAYEMNNRRNWLPVALRSLLAALSRDPVGAG